VSTFDIFFVCETWQKNPVDYNIDGFVSFCIPRQESRNDTSKRGPGGLCIFYNSLLSDGITVVETDHTGVIWLKLCKHVFHYEHDVYVCFSYIPPQNSVYFNLHPSKLSESVETVIRKYSDLGEILWMVDLNVRFGNKSDVLHDCDRYIRFIHTLESDHNPR